MAPPEGSHALRHPLGFAFRVLTKSCAIVYVVPESGVHAPPRQSKHDDDERPGVAVRSPNELRNVERALLRYAAC